MIVVFDGPEKAGKSTIINGVRRALWAEGITCSVVKMGHMFPDDTAYMPHIQAHSQMDQVVIWDGCWAAEAVYGKLLDRPNRPLANDPWLGEWTYGRAAALKFMVKGLQQPMIRDKTDLDTDPKSEALYFEKYGEHFGWHPMENDFTADCLAENVLFAFANIGGHFEYPTIHPPFLVGPFTNHNTLFLIDPQEVGPRVWLPFSGAKASVYGRVLGAKAFQCTWADANKISTKEVLKYENVVMCGRMPNAFVRWFRSSQNIIDLPHPVDIVKLHTSQAPTLPQDVYDALIEIKESI